MITKTIVNTDVYQPFIDGVPFNHMGFVFKRFADGHAATNVPWVIVQGSPDGFEWGYEGSGPADLALNILQNTGAWLLENNYLKVSASSITFDVMVHAPILQAYQEFKREFIAKIPHEGGYLPFSAVVKFLLLRTSIKTIYRETLDYLIHTADGVLLFPQVPFDNVINDLNKDNPNAVSSVYSLSSFLSQIKNYFNKRKFCDSDGPNIAISFYRDDEEDTFYIIQSDRVFTPLVYDYALPDAERRGLVHSPGDLMLNDFYEIVTDLFSDSSKWIVRNEPV